jgi:RimJ/RimL family protein N-acetyltransferase
MPWATAEAADPVERRAWIAERLDGLSRDTFRAIVVDGAIAGGCGIHRRLGPTAVELGYWVATAWTGHGVATAAVKLLCAEAFADETITHIEIHHDAGNPPSGAVAHHAGFTHTSDITRAPEAPADGTIERIWRLTRADWDASTRLRPSRPRR